MRTPSAGAPARLKFLADESFDEGTHIDQLLRAPQVAQDLRDED